MHFPRNYDFTFKTGWYFHLIYFLSKGSIKIKYSEPPKNYEELEISVNHFKWICSLNL